MKRMNGQLKDWYAHIKTTIMIVVFTCAPLQNILCPNIMNITSIMEM